LLRYARNDGSVLKIITGIGVEAVTAGNDIPERVVACAAVLAR
jgi:hypothetical protein